MPETGDGIIIADNKNKTKNNSSSSGTPNHSRVGPVWRFLPLHASPRPPLAEMYDVYYMHDLYDLYDLYDLHDLNDLHDLYDQYDLAHVTGWETCNLLNLVHVPWVGYILRISSTASDNGK